MNWRPLLIGVAMLTVACSSEPGTGTHGPDAGAPDTRDPGDAAQSDPSTGDAEPGDVSDDDADTPDTGADTRADGPSDTSADTSDAGDDADEMDAADAADAADVDEDMGDRGSWETAAPLAGGARQETSVVALGGEIYVLGGFNESLTVVPTVEAYNPDTDSWRPRADLPVRLHHANAAVVGDDIWVVGFLTGLGFVPDGRMYRYDRADDAWSEQGRMPDGRDRGASAVGVLRGRIYVAGGLRGAAVRDFSTFDPDTGMWEALPPLPNNADHVVGGAVGGVFYVAGGRNRRIATHTAELWAFNPDVGTWESRPDMPTSRAGHAAAVLNGGLYVFGGEGYEGHPSEVHDQAEVFEPATGRWRSLTSIPTRRHGTGAAALGGSIYLPGGADIVAFNATDAHEVFTP
jgi:N-acetylneuraminic acid mutarotase